MNKAKNRKMIPSIIGSDTKEQRGKQGQKEEIKSRADKIFDLISKL